MEYKTPLPPAPMQRVEALRRLVAHARANGQGAVVFLAGEPGSGRTQFLTYAAEALIGHRVRVVTGRLTDGRFVSDAPEAALSEEAESVLTTSVSAGMTLLDPTLPIVNQVIRLSAAAYRQLERIRQRSERIELSDLAVRLLRNAAAERPGSPLVCLVDDADAIEGAWWVNLQLAFAQEIRDGLPLILVFAIDSTGELVASEVADDLIARGLATRWTMPPLNRQEIVAWLGPAPADLLETALQLTEGRAGDLVELFGDWERRHVIESGSQGWRMTGDAELLLTDAADALSARLVALIGDKPTRLRAVRELLGCAALQGRVFTAEAIADALGWNREAVNDLIDERLAAESTSDGVLAEVGGVTIARARGDVQHVWRYRFVRGTDWRVARQRFVERGKRRAHAKALARALTDLYQPEEWRVAASLAYLWRVGGRQEAARRYATSEQLQLSRTALRGLAHRLLTAETEGWGATEFATAAALLMDAFAAVFHYDPLSETLELTKRAVEFSRAAGSTDLEGAALNAQGYVHFQSGGLDQANACFKTARSIAAVGAPQLLAQAIIGLADVAWLIGDYATARALATEALGPASGDSEARALLVLAEIELAVKNLSAARARCDQSLVLWRAIGNQVGEAAAQHTLGTIEIEVGELESARERTEAALRVYRTHGDRNGEARAQNQLAGIALLRGDLPAASDLLTAAGSTARSLGDRSLEAGVLNQLADIAGIRADFPLAEQQTQQALDIFRTVGERSGEVRCLVRLASVERLRGEYASARAHAQGALRLARELGGGGEESRALCALGELDLRASEVDAAREGIQSALAISRSARDRWTEAHALNQQAALALATGDHDAAAANATAALAVYRRSGPRAGEARALQCLAAVAIAQRRFEAADEHGRSALAVSQELGDRAGVVIARLELSRLALALQDHDAARGEAKAALDLARSIGYRAIAPVVLHQLGAIALDLEDVETALGYTTEALELARAIEDRAAEIDCMAQLNAIPEA